MHLLQSQWLLAESTIKADKAGVEFIGISKREGADSSSLCSKESESCGSIERRPSDRGVNDYSNIPAYTPNFQRQHDEIVFAKFPAADGPKDLSFCDSIRISGPPLDEISARFDFPMGRRSMDEEIYSNSIREERFLRPAPDDNIYAFETSMPGPPLAGESLEELKDENDSFHLVSAHVIGARMVHKGNSVVDVADGDDIVECVGGYSD